uniref:Envelope protein n=1 Tax=Astyanax mexicanus TaxID=7994 RepID=A0A3B1KH13_ASTMX
MHPTNATTKDQPTQLNRTKRATITQSNSKCIWRWGGIELDYHWGETTAWTVNLCDVVTCGKLGSKGEAVYCVGPVMIILSVTITPTKQLIRPDLVTSGNTVTDKPTIDTDEATKSAIDNNGGHRSILGTDYSTWTTEQIVKLSTGFEGSNLWIKWINAQAREANMDGCPAPLFPTEDPIGFQCMINLTRMPNPANCTALSNIFPVIANNTGSGQFQIPDSGNFTCFNHTAGDETKHPKQLGNINPNLCHTIFNADSGNSIGPWARAGLLPTRGQGLCAMVRLISPITVYCAHKTISNFNRPRRSDDYDFDLTKNTPTYIDAIVDQIAAGWESILLWITPNKTVDRINYVNNQVMRLANITGAAITGLSEQLSATSLMTIQNRIALDMVLANQGGVCHMFGDVCCTVIPNNTAPDGKVTKALIALKALSREMAENTGVDNPITQWLERTFGQWKGVFVSMASAVAVFAAILVTCGCCCVPCIRSLIERTITRMMEGKDDKPPYMLPILEYEEEQEEML